MSEEEERDLYEKSIRSENTLWKRIKRWFSPKKIVKTIHDVDYFDWDMVVKLFCIILLCMVISQIGGMIADIWFWFFPRVQTKGGEWGYFMPALMAGFFGVNQVQQRQTEYEKYKDGRDPVFNGKGKRLISKAGTINDGPCPLSTEGLCNVARDQGREFYCGSNWWKSCTVYLEKREVKI